MQFQPAVYLKLALNVDYFIPYLHFPNNEIRAMRHSA